MALVSVMRPSDPRPLGVAFLGMVCATLFSSCALAPGMRYSQSAPSEGAVDSSTEVGGMRVLLRSLTAKEVQSVVTEETARQQSNSIPSELLAYHPPSYAIGKHDVVTIAIWEHPELSLPLGEYRSDAAVGQTVDDGGDLYFPYVGDVRAEGLTMKELREKLREGLSKVLTNPQLDVKVTGFRSQKIYVDGAVAHPGPVALTDLPLSLAEAVNSTSPDLSLSDLSQVELTRDGKTWVVDLFSAGSGKRDAAHIWMRDGDVVRVPSTEENKVYVLGEVEKSLAVPMVSGRLSLVKALADAGGLSSASADAENIYIIRGGSSAIRVWRLEARNPLALALADRFPLDPRDVIYVDATGLATWNRVINLLLPTTDLFNQTATGAAEVKTLVPRN